MKLMPCLDEAIRSLFFSGFNDEVENLLYHYHYHYHSLTAAKVLMMPSPVDV